MKTKTNTHEWFRSVIVTLLTIACLLYPLAAITPVRAVSDSKSVPSLDTSSSSSPANDDFDSPIVINSTSFTNNQDTTGAATAPDDPVFTCVSGRKYNTVWYSFTPPASGAFDFDTKGSDYDTVLGIWTGGRGSLTSVGCNDDTDDLQSRLQIAMSQGQTYYIEIASHSTGGGQLTLNVGSCGPRVLIWQDAAPWGTTSNQQVLAANGLCADIHPSSQMGSINMSQYSFVMIPGDQPTSFYNNYRANESTFTSYVQNGGVLSFSGAAWGWHNGNAYLITLPGGVRVTWRYETTNRIVDINHPVVAGIPNPFTGTNASHGYFYGGSFLTIIEDAHHGPTLVEYTLGAGRVIAYTQPLEYGYTYGAYRNEAKQTEFKDSTGNVIDKTYLSNLPQSQASGQILQNLISYLKAPPPAPFNRFSPANGAINQPTSPTLSWSASSGASSYEYCYSENDECSGWVSTGTNTSVKLSSLKFNTTYYWWVRANNSFGTTYADESTDPWNFTTVAPITFNSIGSQDGWILESSETSGTGGSMNASALTFQLGDDKLNRQYRVLLSFDTASLPDNAIIQTAVLKIKQSGSPVGSNPFSILGSLYADIRKGWFGSSSALQLADFNAAATASKVGTFGKTPVSGWCSATLNSTGRSKINKTGLTQFRLYFSKDDNDNWEADFMKFVSGNASGGNPQLIVTYTLP